MTEPEEKTKPESKLHSRLQRSAEVNLVPIFIFTIIVLILIILMFYFYPTTSYYQRGVNDTIHNQTFVNSIVGSYSNFINQNLINQLEDSYKYSGKSYAILPITLPNNSTIKLYCVPS